VEHYVSPLLKKKAIKILEISGYVKGSKSKNMLKKLPIFIVENLKSMFLSLK
jgi:hypothetical protein